MCKNTNIFDKPLAVVSNYRLELVARVTTAFNTHASVTVAYFQYISYIKSP